MKRLTALLAPLLLAACGGGGGSSDTGAPPSPPPPPPPPVTQAEAFQLLNQASFGATEAAAADVISLGLESWVDRQMTATPSLQLPYLQSLPRPMPIGQLHQDRVDVWFRNALNGNDQLRQRVAFALSQIMVVSQNGALQGAPYAVADYYDMLTRNAFGNFRDLIEDVTLHPAMGVYLSMLGNEKPNTELNIRPDENYARELMQLFSIGLVELNTDGTTVFGADNQPVPTYNQAVIEGFAHVFTGWNYAGFASFEFARPTEQNQVVPMQLYPEFHDTGAKQLLGTTVLPAGQSGEQDLSDALDNVFNHPNVGPFIAIRLIQRLTTSNPSPDYVRRVAEVFNDDGTGERGDLAAVVQAILLDPEARPELATGIDGKLKEPLVRVTQLWRAYNATSADGGFRATPVTFIVGQGPLQAPSVFNFYSPFYAPPGEISQAGYVAPELQIATEYQNTFITNFFFYQAFIANQLNVDDLGRGDVYIDFSEELDIAADPTALVNRVADKLLGGVISDTLRTEITTIVTTIPATDAAVRVAEAIYLVSTSPEFATQM
ncbi:MAG: DUF1800 domain-containing protein [Pseudomonadota bacterium]